MTLTGVTREWLTPVRPYFEKLAAMAMSKNVTDEAFIEALEKSQTEMPELFDQLNVEALQTSMEDAIGTAMIAGSVERYEGQQVEAYDPNQKRAAKGEANGGQWIKEDGSSSDDADYEQMKEARDEAINDADKFLSNMMMEGRGELKTKDGGTIIITPSSKPDIIVQVTKLDKNDEPLWDRMAKDEDEFFDMLNDPALQDAALMTIRPDIAMADRAFGIEQAREDYLFDYNLRLRDVGPGTVPDGFVSASGRKVSYSRPLTRQEIYDFEIKPVGATPRKGK